MKMFYILLGNKKTYSFHKAGILVSLFFILVLFSCTRQGKTWAKVNNQVLTEEDAKTLMDFLGYDFDSKDHRKKFTHEWINKQVFLQELKKTNPTEFEKMQLNLEWQSGDLAKFHLEEAYINNMMTEGFSDSLVLDYFEKHKEDFVLNDYIIKALYIKVPIKAPKQEQLKQDFLLKKDKDFTKVISYAKLYAENFYYNDSTWVYFEEMLKDAPVEKLNKDNIILNRAKTYFSDENYVYYLNIIDYKLKDAVPPLEFLKPAIIQLLTSRKLNQLKEQKGASFLKTIKQKHEITSKY